MAQQRNLHSIFESCERGVAAVVFSLMVWGGGVGRECGQLLFDRTKGMRASI